MNHLVFNLITIQRGWQLSPLWRKRTVEGMAAGLPQMLHPFGKRRSWTEHLSPTKGGRDPREGKHTLRRAELGFLFRRPWREVASGYVTPARCADSLPFGQSLQGKQSEENASSARGNHTYYVHRHTTSCVCLVTSHNLFVGVVCLGGGGFLPF